MGGCHQRKPALESQPWVWDDWVGVDCCGSLGVPGLLLQRFRGGRSITESPQLGFLTGGFVYLWANFFFLLSSTQGK